MVGRLLRRAPHADARSCRGRGAACLGSGTSAVGVVRGVVATGAAVVAVGFLTLFVSLGGRSWFEALLALLPPSAQVRCRRTGTGIASAIGGYVTGNLFISRVAGAFTTLILLILGVPFAVPLGVLVAVFDLIPLVGATLGTIVVAAVALTHGLATMAIVVALLGIPAAGAIKVVTRELVAWRRGQDAPPAGPRPRRRAAATELRGTTQERL